MKYLLILKLFISEYLDQILSWKEMNEVSPKLQTKNFWLRIFRLKIKQNSSCLNKEDNPIFKHIHQNIRVCPRSKKRSGLINNLEKYYCILGRIRAKRDVGKPIRFIPNTVRESWRQHKPRRILKFLPSFKLKQNFYLNMNISFPWKLPS